VDGLRFIRALRRVRADKVTLRQYVEMQTRVRGRVCAAILIASMLGTVVMKAYLPRVFGPWLFAPTGLSMAFVIFYMGGLRCARCSKSIRDLATAYGGSISRGRGSSEAKRLSEGLRFETLGRCPHCGLRLDEEIGPR
jgi:DNA-directed RNA polymerase subunit RPC12/RpoP